MNHNFKIMVVEDEAITAMMICSELDLKGYTVGEPVSSGEEGPPLLVECYVPV